ncbi:hypothetical protein MIAR_04350 [Microbacterium arabinogalactanolyticum]|uniref:Uncharacterized protein n=2 Tax=Microbacterium arabinogalactanolyticum TaxID=69365 RepID=A0ABQ5NEA5_9MICO|nr:hypothetical protein MIAR_04350 [Microbacterium arabinogalactanolyticum]
MRPSIEVRTARRFWVIGGLVAALALTGCSSPLDVSAAERAVAATCEALEPLPGVSTASCVVDDGGFDAGIRRRTAVELEDGATAEQARTLVAAWLSSEPGGAEEYAIQGSRATPLQVTVSGRSEASFSVAPGAPAPSVAFVQEWLGRATRGVPIVASVADTPRISIAQDGLSPAEQAALLDEFGMRTRSDGLVLEIGSGSSATNGASSVEAPIPATLYDALGHLETVYRTLSNDDPDRELAFTMDADPVRSPMLRLRVPTDLIPAGAPGQPVTGTSGWPTIRAILEAAAPGGADYGLTIAGRPGDVVGGISTSGCAPDVPGPRPRYDDELQAEWAIIHDVPAPGACE